MLARFQDNMCDGLIVDIHCINEVSALIIGLHIRLSHRYLQFLKEYYRTLMLKVFQQTCVVCILCCYMSLLM
jgi:hypothetical protein